MKLKILHFFILVVLSCFLFSKEVQACSCVRVPPTGEARDVYLQEQFEGHDFVFQATVTDQRDGAEQFKKFWDLKVEKVWKGNIPDTSTYESSQAMCSAGDLKKGETYLIYATAHRGEDGTQNTYDISSCSYTRPASVAQEAIALLEGDPDIQSFKSCTQDADCELAYDYMSCAQDCTRIAVNKEKMKEYNAFFQKKCPEYISQCLLDAPRPQCLYGFCLRKSARALEMTETQAKNIATEFATSKGMNVQADTFVGAHLLADSPDGASDPYWSITFITHPPAGKSTYFFVNVYSKDRLILKAGK